jgi:hypothetical protein
VFGRAAHCRSAGQGIGRHRSLLGIVQNTHANAGGEDRQGDAGCVFGVDTASASRGRLAVVTFVTLTP